VGSTAVADWQPYSTHSNPGSIYGAAMQRAADAGCRYAVYWQGEQDATVGTSTATYESSLNTLINDFYADTGLKTVVYQINYAGGAYCTLANYNAIVAAQLNVGATNSNAYVGPNMNGLWTGNVHYQTSADIAAVSQAAFNVLGALFYGGDQFITNNPAAVTAAGSEAAVNSTLVSANLGVVTDAGLEASISQLDTVSANLGAVSDAGQGASVVATDVVTGNLGAVADSGQEASVASTDAVSASLGVVTDAGLGATIGGVATTINASLGSAVAAGNAVAPVFVMPPKSRVYRIPMIGPASPPIFLKDPTSVLDYAFDWADWLPPGDAISGSPVITIPAGITLDAAPIVNGTQVVYWLSGATVGVYYSIDCTIMTVDGRTDSRSIQIRCRIL